MLPGYPGWVDAERRGYVPTSDGVRRPSLVPLFQSETQVGVLGALFAASAGPMTVTDLADAVGLPLSSVSREVARLEATGILHS